MSDKIKNTDKLQKIILSGIIIRLLIFIIRICFPSEYVDESMLHLNALSIANNQTDIFGNIMPLYFGTWLIGGQSALPTYISALSIKILGDSIIALRLPFLFLNIASYLAIIKFGKELFKSSKDFLKIAIIVSFVPLFYGDLIMYLDCSYMNYFISFGLLCFLYAAKRNKKGLYFISTILFAICFYSYIAAILLIPFLLLYLYLYQIKQKQIQFRVAILNACLLIFLLIPYILFELQFAGLYSKEIQLWKFTIPAFDACKRYFPQEISLLKCIEGVFINIADIFNGISSETLLGFTRISLFAILFIITVIILLIKKQRMDFSISKKQLLYFVVFIPYLLLSEINVCRCTYRFIGFSYLLIPIIYYFFRFFINHKSGKIILIGMVCINLIMCTCILPNSSVFSDYSYYNGTDLYVFDYYNEKCSNKNLLILASDYAEAQNQSIAIREFFGNNNFVNFKNEQTYRLSKTQNEEFSRTKISDNIYIADNISLINNDDLILTDKRASKYLTNYKIIFKKGNSVLLAVIK